MRLSPSVPEALEYADDLRPLLVGLPRPMTAMRDTSVSQIVSYFATRARAASWLASWFVSTGIASRDVCSSTRVTSSASSPWSLMR
jgi:hypothetical protein